MSDKRIDTLFTRFTAIYGQLWLVAYANEKVLEFAKLEWTDSLKEFNNNVLKLALEKTKKTQLYPPTLPIFVACCIATKKDLQERQEAITNQSEIHKKTDPKIVKFHVDQMMASLTKQSKENKQC